MAFSETLPTSLSGHMGGLDFLILPLLIFALIATYCWSVLGTKAKLALCFSVGVFVFKVLFEQLIDKRLFPDLHSYIPFVLGSITAGLLETGAFLLANRTMIIGIFLGGALFPFLFLAHSNFLDLTKSWVAPPLLALAAIVIFSGLVRLKITHIKPFQLVSSVICGALGTVYLIGLSCGFNDCELLDIDMFQAIIRLVQKSRLSGIICLSISGLIVQSLLHLALRKLRQLKLKPSKFRPENQAEVQKRLSVKLKNFYFM